MGCIIYFLPGEVPSAEMYTMNCFLQDQREQSPHTEKGRIQTHEIANFSREFPSNQPHSGSFPLRHAHHQGKSHYTILTFLPAPFVGRLHSHLLTTTPTVEMFSGSVLLLSRNTDRRVVLPRPCIHNGAHEFATNSREWVSCLRIVLIEW